MQADEPVYLWPENLRAWECWLEVQTQWQYASMSGQRTGLNYAGVHAFLVAEVPNVRERRTIFEAIRAAERECLQVWFERQKNTAHRKS